MAELQLDDLPEPVQPEVPRWRLSPIWLVPLVAAFAGALLLLRSCLAAGPSITIEFDTAEDLEAGKTEVRYKHVAIGTVRDIELIEGARRVRVEVDLVREASHVAVKDSQFWVAKVRADLGGISGFKTLVSGAYIAVNVGTSEERETEFIGLEKPPTVTNDQKGRRFMLKAADLGSLNVGSPIYFRRIPVGRIVSFDLDADGSGVSVGAFVDAPYDRFVTQDARFWNASGVDLSLDARGLKLDTQSLLTLIAGGVAFQPHSGNLAGTAAAQDASFRLYANESVALALEDDVSMTIRMRFQESTRGLAVDAPVDFKGVALGKVTAVELDYDVAAERFVADVTATIYPRRLGQTYQDVINTPRNGPITAEALFKPMVARGLHAQLRAGNLLTGQLYVGLDFLPKQKATNLNLDARPLQVPTTPASLDQLQARITDIVAKIDSVPFEDIGKALRDALSAADATLRQLDSDVAPAATAALREAQAALESANRSLISPDAPLQQDLGQTLIEVKRAVRSLRDLSDYLQRHPDALLRGRRDTEQDSADEAP